MFSVWPGPVFTMPGVAGPQSSAQIPLGQPAAFSGSERIAANDPPAARRRHSYREGEQFQNNCVKPVPMTSTGRPVDPEVNSRLRGPCASGTAHETSSAWNCWMSVRVKGGIRTHSSTPCTRSGGRPIASSRRR